MHVWFLAFLLFGLMGTDWSWGSGRAGGSGATVVDDGGTVTAMDGGNGEPPPPRP